MKSGYVKVKLDMHTNARADVLRTTGVVGVKVWFIPCQVDPSKGNFEYMTGLLMNNFPV
jgi:ribosomal protein S3